MRLCSHGARVLVSLTCIPERRRLQCWSHSFPHPSAHRTDHCYGSCAAPHSKLPKVNNLPKRNPSLHAKLTKYSYSVYSNIPINSTDPLSPNTTIASYCTTPTKSAPPSLKSRAGTLVVVMRPRPPHTWSMLARVSATLCVVFPGFC